MSVSFLNFPQAEPHHAKPEVCSSHIPMPSHNRRPARNRAGNVDRCKEISARSPESVVALHVVFEQKTDSAVALFEKKDEGRYEVLPARLSEFPQGLNSNVKIPSRCKSSLFLS
jgi:hypothetical protein